MKIVGFLLGNWKLTLIGVLLLIISLGGLYFYLDHRIHILETKHFLKGYNAATDKCEIDKAQDIEHGNKARAGAENEIQKFQDPDIINFLNQHGWLRSS